MGERWQVIPTQPAYEASNLGRIRRIAGGRGAVVGRILKTPPDSEGYPTVNIGGQPRRVHVLVADAFLGPIPDGGQVHHLNGDHGDARLVNLRVKESQRHHMEEHRTRDDLRRHGELNPDIPCACGCGTMFAKYDGDGRPRRFVKAHQLRKAA